MNLILFSLNEKESFFKLKVRTIGITNINFTYLTLIKRIKELLGLMKLYHRKI